MEERLSEKLASLGIELPAVAGPFGAYVPAKKVGAMVFIAGQLPMRSGKLIATGAVPSKCSIESAMESAKQCVINALAAAATVIDINLIRGVARVGVFVNCDASFTQQPQVANAASEFLLELFGETGKHARAAVGVVALPMDACVEIEVIFEI